MITRTRLRPIFFLVLILLPACGGGGKGDFGPKVIGTDPSDKATNVPVQRPINAVFSYAMDPKTVYSDTFVLNGPGGPIKGKIVYQNKTATFTPDALLERGINYTAMLTTGVKDLDGIPLPSNFTWTFETEGGEDKTPPTVVSRTPSIGATGVASDSPVLVTFSEPMNPESFNEKTLFIKGVAAKYDYNEDGLNGPTARVSPKEELALNRTYEVTVTKGVTDKAGNGLAADVTWTFTTVKEKDVKGPDVKSRAPEGNNVPVNTNITVTFDEEINTEKTPLQPYFILEDLEGDGAVSIHPPHYANKVVTLDPVSDLRSNTQYRVTVKAGIEDFSGNKKSSDTIWLFRTGKGIDITPPGVESLFPEDGATRVSVQTDVAATFDEAIDLRTVPTGSVNGGGESIPLDFVPANGGSESLIRLRPSHRLKSGTPYQVVLSKESISDLAGNQISAHLIWTFTTENAPVVEQISPLNGDVLNGPPSSITATFSRIMSPDTIKPHSFRLDILDSQRQVVGSVPGEVRSENLGHRTVAAFTPDAPLSDADYRVELTTAISDPAGNPLASSFVWSFRVASDPVRPLEVTSTDPGRDEVVSKGLPQISVQFNQPIDLRTLEDRFSMTGSDGSRFSWNEVDDYRPDQQRAIFRLPGGFLADGVRYTGELEKGVRSQSGATLEEVWRWEFSVEQAPDTEPPRVAATQPPLDAVNVPLNTTIQGIFNERIHPDSVGPSTFFVQKSPSGGDPAVVAGRWEVASETVSFIPSQPLESGTRYEAVLKVGISDLRGNSLAADFAWSFTTAP